MAVIEKLIYKMIKDVSFVVKNIFYPDHKWNKEKITLNICVEKTNAIEEYFVVGNISELGRWKINNKMKKNPSNSRQKSNK